MVGVHTACVSTGEDFCKICARRDQTLRSCEALIPEFVPNVKRGPSRRTFWKKEARTLASFTWPGADVLCGWFLSPQLCSVLQHLIATARWRSSKNDGTRRTSGSALFDEMFSPPHDGIGALTKWVLAQCGTLAGWSPTARNGSVPPHGLHCTNVMYSADSTHGTPRSIVVEEQPRSLIPGTLVITPV